MASAGKGSGVECDDAVEYASCALSRCSRCIVKRLLIPARMGEMGAGVAADVRKPSRLVRNLVRAVNIQLDRALGGMSPQPGAGSR